MRQSSQDLRTQHRFVSCAFEGYEIHRSPRAPASEVSTTDRQATLRARLGGVVLACEASSRPFRSPFTIFESMYEQAGHAQRPPVSLGLATAPTSTISVVNPDRAALMRARCEGSLIATYTRRCQNGRRTGSKQRILHRALPLVHQLINPDRYVARTVGLRA
jgi:hypothetical protein